MGLTKDCRVEAPAVAVSNCIVASDGRILQHFQWICIFMAVNQPPFHARVASEFLRSVFRVHSSAMITLPHGFTPSLVWFTHWPISLCDSSSACNHIMAHNCPAQLDSHNHIGFYFFKLLEVKWVMSCFIQKAQLSSGAEEEGCVILSALKPK